jgi:hypothetical protein
MMQTITVTQSDDQFIFAVQGQEQQAPLTKEELRNVFVFVCTEYDAYIEKVDDYIFQNETHTEPVLPQVVVVPHLPLRFTHDDMPMLSAVISDVLAPRTYGDETHVQWLVRTHAEIDGIFDGIE